MTDPEASIVVPTKNAGPLFREVLEGVYDQPGSFDVLVVDSGSTDETTDIVAEYPARLLEIPPESFHHGRTRNLGVEETTGDFVVFLTQDATPMDGWLPSLLSALRSDADVAGAYSRQLPRPSATPMKRHFLASFYDDEPETRSLAPGRRPTRDEVFFSNVSSVVRRSVWRDHPFPENSIMSEDQHWARTVLEAGYKLRYEPGSRVRHSHREGIRDIFKRYFDTGASLDPTTLASRDTSLFADMLRYQFDEFRYLIANGYAAWLPYAVAYSGAKFLGLQLGERYERLPTPVVRRLSDTLSRKYDE